MNTTETRELRCDLAEHEIVERSLEQNNKMLEVARYEAERRGINQQIKEREERIDELRVIILSGYEKRDVECEWFYDWSIGTKFLHRTDNGALIEQQPIRENEKQPKLNLQPKIVKETPLFDPCPSGPCVMVKTGSTCAPAFCGKQPPKVTDSKQLFKVNAATCEHPVSMRFQDSNALVCEACGTVLETFTTDPVGLVTEEAEEMGVSVCRNVECDSNNKSEPNGCTLYEHVYECEGCTHPAMVDDEDQIQGEAA